MTLENPNVIDVLATPEPGKLELVVCDAGVTVDPRERMDKLLAKLRAYATYVLSEEFPRKHPGVGIHDVRISVICAAPPTPDMLNVTHIRPRTEPPREIAIHFSMFDGIKTTPLTPPPLETPDRDRLLPRLVTQEFLNRVPSHSPVPHRELGDTGLFIVYVEDGEHAVRFLTRLQAEEMGLSEYELHELALENLAQTLDMEQVVRRTVAERSLTTIKAMDTYDAARLLLVPGCLQPGETVAVLIPDRDTLTLLQPPEDGNWTPLAELAKVAASNYLLLDRPVRVTADGFEVM